METHCALPYPKGLLILCLAGFPVPISCPTIQILNIIVFKKVCHIPWILTFKIETWVSEDLILVDSILLFRGLYLSASGGLLDLSFPSSVPDLGVSANLKPL